MTAPLAPVGVLDAMKMALKALEAAYKILNNSLLIKEAISALTSAIEQMEKAEPVAYIVTAPDGYNTILRGKTSVSGHTNEPLYTHPAPQQTCPATASVDATSNCECKNPVNDCYEAYNCRVKIKLRTKDDDMVLVPRESVSSNQINEGADELRQALAMLNSGRSYQYVVTRVYKAMITAWERENSK